MNNAHGLEVDGNLVYGDGTIIIRAAPGPWHDCIAAMYERGVSVQTVAQNFKLSQQKVRAVVRWVRQSDRRIKGIPEYLGETYDKDL